MPLGTNQKKAIPKKGPERYCLFSNLTPRQVKPSSPRENTRYSVAFLQIHLQHASTLTPTLPNIASMYPAWREPSYHTQKVSLKQPKPKNQTNPQATGQCTKSRAPHPHKERKQLLNLKLADKNSRKNRNAGINIHSSVK